MNNTIDETDYNGIPAFLKRVATKEEIETIRQRLIEENNNKKWK